MPPLELPGGPLGSRKSKKKATCPRCGTVYPGSILLAKIKNLKLTRVKLKCENCGREFIYTTKN